MAQADIARSGASALFDTHTHLNVEAYDDDRPAVVERARRAGVQEMLVVGYDLESSRSALAVAEEYGLQAIVGIQPHYAGTAGQAEVAAVGRLTEHPRAVAVGEIGLDYYRDRAPRADQRRLLIMQLELAREVGLPVAIHCRDAYDDLLDVLREAGREVRGVMHCFSGTLEHAHACLSLGLYISIAGPVTYPKAPRLWQVAREVPLERLLIETDCPWLTPQAHRGRRNEPAYVREVAARIAELRGLPLEQAAEATTRNARELFLKGRPGTAPEKAL